MNIDLESDDDNDDTNEDVDTDQDMSDADTESDGFEAGLQADDDPPASTTVTAEQLRPSYPPFAMSDEDETAVQLIEPVAVKCQWLQTLPGQ